jgi:8-oxo-dGTP diphosphatase
LQRPATGRGRIVRWLLSAFGGPYNDLIGRRTHLGVGAVIFDDRAQVLLVRQSYGGQGWELPGGGRGRNESVEAAVRREVLEEVGVEVLTAELRAVYYEADVDQHHFAFRCRLAPGFEPRPSSAEILECRFWPADALPRPITEFTVQRIADARSSEPIPAIRTIRARRWIG